MVTRRSAGDCLRSDRTDAVRVCRLGTGAPRRELDSLPHARRRTGPRPGTRPRRLPRHPDQRCRAAVCRKLGRLAPDAAGASVPGARRALHLPRPVEPAHLGGEGSRDAAGRSPSRTTSAPTNRRARSGWTAGRIRRCTHRIPSWASRPVAGRATTSSSRRRT